MQHPYIKYSSNFVHGNWLEREKDKKGDQKVESCN